MARATSTSSEDVRGILKDCCQNILMSNVLLHLRFVSLWSCEFIHSDFLLVDDIIDIYLN
jgi:geranylgeranyl pyrophosphate synthase